MSCIHTAYWHGQRPNYILKYLYNQNTFVHAYFYSVQVFALITPFMMHPDIIEKFKIA